MSTPRSTTSGSEREQGTGLVATLAGVLVFLVLLMLATQVLFDLYATSVVTAVAFDAARVVAGADAGDTGAVTDAETAARAQLGRYGDRARFEWRLDGDVVQLHVRAVNPSLLPASLKRPLGVDTVDRTVRVRVERLR